jgi:hypothetical protein
MKYFDYVRAVAEGPKPSPVILNRSAEHAAVILERLFLTATDRVSVLSNALSDDVYGSVAVQDSAVQFLKSHPQGKINLLVERPEEDLGSLFLKRLTDAGVGQQVCMSVLSPEVVADYRFNFAVADGCSYRFEEDRQDRHASVQFGNRSFGETLEDAFAELKSTAKSTKTLAA